MFRLMLGLVLGLASPAAEAADAQRGELLAGLARCGACHTEKDGAPFAGGFALETPAGTFYGTNITPDPEHGLGSWTLEDFVRAMRHGTSPRGAPYYPAFPYPSFTKMTDGDLADLWAYLQTLPAVDRPNTPHELPFPFSVRPGVALWKLVELQPGPMEAPDTPEGRGQYLAEAVAHCGECHTPRNVAMGLRSDLHMAGSEAPESSPNITPHEDGVEGWSARDLSTFFSMGMEPDGDFTGAGMAGVIDDGTSRLSNEDREALVAWMQSLPPISSEHPAGLGYWLPTRLYLNPGLTTVGGLLIAALGLAIPMGLRGRHRRKRR